MTWQHVESQRNPRYLPVYYHLDTDFLFNVNALVRMAPQTVAHFWSGGGGGSENDVRKAAENHR